LFEAYNSKLKVLGKTLETFEFRFVRSGTRQISPIDGCQYENMKKL